MPDLSELSVWLEGTQLSAAIANRAWAVPTLQSIHILAVSIVMASVAVLNLRFAGFLSREQSLRSYNLRHLPWIWGALIVILLTGFLQVMAEPSRELLNWIFLTKMALVVAAVTVTAAIRRMLEDCRFRDMPAARRYTMRVMAVLAMGIWVAIIVCGRWIAYAGDVS